MERAGLLWDLGVHSVGWRRGPQEPKVLINPRRDLDGRLGQVLGGDLTRCSLKAGVSWTMWRTDGRGPGGGQGDGAEATQT